MKAKIARLLLISATVLSLTACGAPEVITQTVRNNTPARFTEGGYRQYLNLMLGDNTEYIDNVTDEEDGTYTESEASLSEAIAFDYEPVDNGMFIYITNSGSSDVSVSGNIPAAGKDFTVPCLMPGESRGVFMDVPGDTLSKGYVVNPGAGCDDTLPAVYIRTDKSTGSLFADVSGEADPADMTASELATAASLEEKGYLVFPVPKDIRDFTVKYYAGGNLSAGGNMETSEAYRFGEAADYYAVKAPADILIDSAEMDVYF